MGYLQINSLGEREVDKLVLSVWFRIPQSTINAVAAIVAAADDPHLLPLKGALPIIVFGSVGHHTSETDWEDYDVSRHSTSHPWLGTSTWLETLSAGPPIVTRQHINTEATEGTNNDTITNTYSKKVETTPGADLPSNPSFIGVDCTGGVGKLVVNFESAQVPNVVGYYYNGIRSEGSPQNATGDTISQGYQDLEHHEPFPNIELANTIHDVTAADTIYTTYENTSIDISSFMMNGTGAICSDGLISVGAEHWCHLIVSVHMKTVATHGRGPPGSGDYTSLQDHTDGASQLFVAFNDANVIGEDLSSFWPWPAGDPNDIVTEDAVSVAEQQTWQDDFSGDPLDTPTYTLSDPKINLGHPFGIPATASLVDTIHVVEMATFQMWAGHTIDTGIEINRRLFLTADGFPADPSAAIASLGTPDISLIGQRNWQAGINGGTAGNFEATGTINPFLPDASIGA